MTQIDLTALAYECALTGYEYGSFLRAVMQILKAAGVSLTRYDRVTDKHIGSAVGVLDLHKHSLRAHPERPRPMPMGLFEPSLFCAQDLDPNVAALHLNAGMTVRVIDQEATSLYITALRKTGAPHFTAQERAAFGEIARNLAGAMHLAQKTGRLHYSTRAVEILDYLSLEIFLFGRDGRLMGANQAAERSLLRKGADFASIDGRLHLPETLLRRFGTLVMKASEDLQTPSLFESDLLESPPRLILGVQLRDFHSDVLGPIALIQLPRDADQAALAILSRLYNLTAKELEVAGALLGGHKLPYIAERLGMSYETARAHSKAIFAKCGVAGQSALILHVTPAIASFDWAQLQKTAPPPFFI